MAKIQLLFSACFFICLATAKKYYEEIHFGKGIPVPHANYIEDIIKKSLFPNKTMDQSFLDLYGDVSDLDNATLDRLQNLEYSVLDVDNVKLFVKLARRSMERSQELAPQLNTRRKAKISYLANAFNRYDGHIMRTLLSLMQQSIYATRLMLQRTNAIRARYRADVSFNIGQMYGTLIELKTKAARALTTCIELEKVKENKLVWYLLLYERILQINVDATTTVYRIFDLNRKGYRQLIEADPAVEKYKSDLAKKNKRISGSLAK